MKYRFAVQKFDDELTDNKIMKEFRIPESTVFSVEISADEMIELMEHLWFIANKRK